MLLAYDSGNLSLEEIKVRIEDLVQFEVYSVYSFQESIKKRQKFFSDWIIKDLKDRIKIKKRKWIDFCKKINSDDKINSNTAKYILILLNILKTSSTEQNITYNWKFIQLEHISPKKS